mgnify:CR=1 FL=1|tara:strand:- start:15632 stop:17086 length:1455 start_codon:yes stop_codon:yes gene_type:complete
MLEFIFSLLILTIIIIFFTKESNIKFLQNFSLLISGIVFLASLYLLMEFDTNYANFQGFFSSYFYFKIWNITYFFAVDGLSIFLIILSTFLIFVCVLYSLQETLLKYYLLNLFFIELLLILVFSVLDLLLFYIFFEAILMPMFLIICIWGSRARKIRAAYLFFFYTLTGSLLLLLGILYIYFLTGTFNFEYLSLYIFTFEQQYWLWLAFFFSFAAKVPLFPFHIWLPEAHVEAPTIGSVLLAGILLKLGIYGFLRFSILFFPDASIFFSPFINTLAIFGIIYASLTAIRQTDIKRIIAYSSVAHMNVIVLGLFSFTSYGLIGALLQTLSHGFVAGALFFLIGILYSRYHSRLLFYYGGIAMVMPLYSSFFLIFTLANIALPGTSSFCGEFLILLGIFIDNFFIAILAALGVILCGSYSLWLYNRLIFGNFKTNYLINYYDLTMRELVILIPFVIFVIVFGIYPDMFFDFTESTILFLFFNNLLI